MTRLVRVGPIAVLVALAAPVAAQDFDKGLAAFKAQDYQIALKELRPLADQGYAPAESLLGDMYSSGSGVPRDTAEAMRWRRLAAEQGDARAQYNVGVMYDHGYGVPQDYAEAVRWYRLAADQGRVDAQMVLGYMYDHGEGVLEDDAEAVRWYRLAAEQGNAWAQNDLGRMYENGVGVPEDDVEAVPKSTPRAEVVTDLAPFTWDSAHPEVFNFDGEISRRTPNLLGSALRRLTGVRVLELSSPGGDAYAAMAMVPTIRAAGLATRIPAGGECHSACSFLFLAGVERAAEGELGVHQLASGNEASGHFIMNDVLDMLDDLAIPDTVRRRMMQTPPNEMYTFSPEELVALGLVGPVHYAPTAPALPDAPQGVLYVTGHAIVRAGPSVGAQAISEFERGSAVVDMGREIDGWRVLLLPNGAAGYVSETQLSLESPK